MKKILTLAVALMATVTTMMAQRPAAMNFAGKGTMTVNMPHAEPQEIPVESDTVVVKDSYTTVVLPLMQYGQMAIPAISLGNLQYTMEGNPMQGNAVFTWEKADTTLTMGEKSINVKNFKAVYHHAENKIAVEASVKYGNMPATIDIVTTGYYIKAYTDKIAVTIDKAYEVENVTYNIRRYKDGDMEKLDVEIPTFSMVGTTIGDLTSGGYTVRGIEFDAEKEAFFRDYTQDGIQMHFAGGSFDKDYEITSLGNISVTFMGKNVAIKNNFQPGTMPFPISTLFDPAGITGVEAVNSERLTVNSVYNIAGQRVAPGTKGLVIINGKKVIR